MKLRETVFAMIGMHSGLALQAHHTSVFLANSTAALIARYPDMITPITLHSDRERSMWSSPKKLFLALRHWSGNNLGQVVHTSLTCASVIITKQYKLVVNIGQKVVIPYSWEGLALHWPCIRDITGLSIYGLTSLIMAPPRDCPVGRLQLYFIQFTIPGVAKMEPFN